MSSQAWTQSLAPTTRCSNWLTNTSHPASNVHGRLIFVQKSGPGLATFQSPTLSNASTEKDGSRERKPHPIHNKKDPVGKMLAYSLGKKNCFNCSGDNHWVVNCPNLLAAQHNEHAGMARVFIDEDILDGIGFLQNESTNALVIKTRKTLNLHRLYLESTSSFHQVFTKDNLDHLKLAGVTLHADCNASTNFATKKGWYQNLFHLWLVRNAIANLLSLLQLEEDGFTVS
jgi:hypothetical protein